MHVDPTACTAAEVAERLRLTRHPEGGYFRETYRSAATVETARGPRSLSTGILFLVASESPSRLHRLTSDELWIHQAGDTLELVVLGAESNEGRRPVPPPARPPVCLLGAVDGAEPQMLVPAGCWQGAQVAGMPVGGAGRSAGTGAHTAGVAAAGERPLSHGWTLVACVVSPGFDYADFELGRRDALLAAFPEQRDLILALT